MPAKGWINPNRKMIVCKTCGKVFYKPPSLSDTIYCSVACKKLDAGVGKKISKSKMGHPVTEKTRLAVSAAHKGKPSNQKGVKHSKERREKSSKAHIGILAGENSPHWKGGITPQVRLIRNSPQMQEWRKAVFEKDNYTDWYSGCKGGELAAHHVIPFHKLMADNNIKTLQEAHNCAALWDVNNGVTMKKKSHLAHHAMWG